MASPMTSTQILSQLKKWGVKYKEYENWETHNRKGHGAWGPVNGFMWHHTGSDSKDQRLLLRKGYSDLPGPLCHFGIAQDGTCWLIGWGRANHAGKIDKDVLDAVIAEKPLPKKNSADVDGNSRLYGMEIWYSGSHDMTAAQYTTAVLISCAIMDFHKWNEKSILGHGEGQPGKWDPGIRSGEMRDMNKVRSDIAKRFKEGPKGMASKDPRIGKSIPEPRSATNHQVWVEDNCPRPKGYSSNDNEYWAHESVLVNMAEVVIQNKRMLEKIMKHLGID